MYKLNQTGSITRLSDNVSIPNDADNMDYAQYLEWISEGNIAELADAIILPTPNELIIAQIADMEKDDLMNRGSRELMLRIMQKEGSSMGLTDDQMISIFPFYRKLKARDIEISDIRKKIV